MLSEALQRNAKHETRLSNTSGCWANRRVQRNHLSLFAPLRMTNGAASLTDRYSFRGQRTGSRTIFTCFTEQLADHVFDRHFLHVYVADVARLEKFPAGFRNLCAWNLQLYRDRCLFGDFTKRRQITCSFFFESKTKNLIAREAIDDLCQRAIEKDFAMVDYQNAMTQCLDVLHVMTGEQCDDAMFLIVDAQKFANAFLANHVQTDCRFIKK